MSVGRRPKNSDANATVKFSRHVPGSANRPRDSWRVKRILLSVVAACLLLTAFLVQRVNTTMGRMERQETINRQLGLLDDLLQDMLNAETGQRGFLLTNRVAYLEPYKLAVGRLGGKLDLLRASESSGTASHQRLVRLGKLIELKLGELETTVRLLNEGQQAQALELVQSDLGKLYMDEARVVLGEMSAGLLAERAILAAQIARAAAHLRLLMIFGAAALLAAAALAVWVLWRTLNVNAKLLRRLEDEATHDPLTGLPNRRYLSEWLTQNMAVAARGNTTVGVFFIDLDGFKAINDRSGHDAGDRVLQAVAGSMRGMLRQSDFVARLGGDEFAVITIDRVGDSSLVRLGERLIDGIAALDLGPDATPGQLGASVGIAIFPSHGDSAEQLIDAADRAMYTAKRRGKGQVRLASGA